MRKILVGVVSVAGLLAVVLALASGPATAQKEADPANVDTVIVYTNVAAIDGENDTSVAGRYSVSWDTLGDCDPGPGTSGASGSLVLTVAATDDLPAVDVDVPATANNNDPAKQNVASREGTEARAVVRTNTDCNYSWEIGLIEAAQGALCVGPAWGTITDNNGSIELAAAGSTTDGEAAPVASLICESLGLLSVTVQPGETDTEAARHAGAVRSTAFAVTATPNDDPNNKADDTCRTVTATADLVDAANHDGLNNEDNLLPLDNPDDVLDNAQPTGTKNDDDRVATLRVVASTVAGAACTYTVSAGLPDGFAASEDDDGTELDSKSKQSPPAVAENRISGTNGDVSIDVTAQRTRITLSVEVALRRVYILQTVDGDAGGGNATYELSGDSSCGIPEEMLPENLVGISSGGIRALGGAVVVELREGPFNISLAVLLPGHMSDTAPKDKNGRIYAPRYALDKDAEPCTVTADVDGLPGNCSAASDAESILLTTDVSDTGGAQLWFTVSCSDDMGGDDAMDATETGGGDDDAMDATETGGGDDDATETDDGPAMDIPTG